MSNVQHSLSQIDLTALDRLADASYLNSLDHAFWDDAPADTSGSDYLHYISEKLFLIAGEAVEAHDEWRSGRGLDEVYYRESDGKPEGLPVEVVDVLVRALDLMGYIKAKTGLSLSEVFSEKFEFNVSRPALHGRKF